MDGEGASAGAEQATPAAADEPSQGPGGGEQRVVAPKPKLMRKSTTAISRTLREKAKRAKAKAKALAEIKPRMPQKRLCEPLLELSQYEKCAIALNEAIHSRCFIEYPGYRNAWDSYVSYQKQDGFLQNSVLGLLLLTLFETPLWCNEGGKWYWNWESAAERCTAARGIPREEIIMSGVIMLPSGIGAIVEYTLLIALMVRLILNFNVQHDFKDCAPSKPRHEVYVSFGLLSLGLLDAAFYWLHPGTRFRLAPYVRFGLAASIPWVQDLLFSFWRVLVAISKAFFFLLGTVLIFAWVLAMIFDDLTDTDRYGDPVNLGFESFGNALYTSFATMTTAITPDVMIPSYVYSRNFVFAWLPFLILATIIFNNVLLATVYSEYQSQYTQRVKDGVARRHFSLHAAFEMIKEKSLDHNGVPCFHVRYETFEKVAKMLRSFHPISADSSLVRLIYEALDTNNDGTLDQKEFFVMCDVLETQFCVTRRDSWLRMHCGETCIGRFLHRIMDNHKEGEDLGYIARFPGSCFDAFMNFVLALNVMWIVFQSAVDLNNIKEPAFFQYIDVFFSLIYLMEVGFKLFYWSWEEYWFHRDNRFDFLTTMILASSALGWLFFEVDRSIIRYLNLLRLVRLLKALNNIPAYLEVWSVIERMVRSCSDVMAMNFLVIYLWSAAGVQLFGGRLVESNPSLAHEDLAYFGSHYQVYNFNDVFMGMVTLFYFTLGTWIDPLAVVCTSLAERYSWEWGFNYAFFLTFYVASPLLAFNVFTSFSIDVFCNLQDMDSEKNKGGSDQVAQNVADVAEKMAEQGYCLHTSESAALSRQKVMRKMFVDSS